MKKNIIASISAIAGGSSLAAKRTGGIGDLADTPEASIAQMRA